MKKVSATLALVMVLALVLATGVGAAGSPPPALSSGFQLQNRSDASTATVLIHYYDPSGVNVETDSDSIAAGASKSYYVPNVLGQPDGRYSVVVESDQPLFALVNEVTASGASPNVSASHSGFTEDTIGSPLYIAWVTCEYWDYNSMIAVQNAGASETTITVEFYQSGNSTAVQSYDFPAVQPGASVFLDMTQDPYNTDLKDITGNGFYGSVVISSTGDATPLAAVLNDTDPAGSSLRSYNAVTIDYASTELVAAQVTSNYWGYHSGITLQNPDPATTANVTLRFYRSGETTPAVTHTGTVAPSSAQAFYLPNIPGMPLDFNGVLVVESTNGVPLIGIANQHHTPPGDAASYNMIPVGMAAQSVSMPQINRDYWGFESGYQLYNVGPEAVDVSVVFSQPDGTIQATIPHNIAAGAALTFYLGGANGAPLGSMFNGGAKATITSGDGGLIGLVNFVSPSGGDSQITYNVFH